MSIQDYASIHDIYPGGEETYGRGFEEDALAANWSSNT